MIEQNDMTAPAKDQTGADEDTSIPTMGANAGSGPSMPNIGAFSGQNPNTASAGQGGSARPGSNDSGLRVHRMPQGIDEDEGQGGGKWGTGLLVVIGLVVFISVVWFAYSKGAKDGAGQPIPVIEADSSPTRMVPEDPGGLEVAHQDIEVFDIVRDTTPETSTSQAPTPTETLAPGPEEPIDLSRMAAPVIEQAETAIVETTASLIEAVDAGAEQVQTAIEDELPGGFIIGDLDELSVPIDVTAPFAEPSPEIQVVDAAPVQPEPAAAEPEKFVPSLTLDISKDVAWGTAPANKPQAQPAAQRQETAPPQPVIRTPSPQPSPRVTTPRPAPQAEAPTIIAAAPTPVPTINTTAGPTDSRVQVGSVGSREGAQAEWRRIQTANPELSSLQLYVQEANLGERGTFYRIQTQALSYDAADQICKTLKSRNQGCIVVNR